PHMYSPGDAVAKVDGYVISITGGGDYVGEKHLVRIEEAGRTSAIASLIDLPASPAVSVDGAGSDDSGLESKPRRRGRRGGRRRSGAKAESVSSSE
ncbi:MAG: ribonuclease E, partial [Solirubrobacterales bacterium]|nr:ribonuclease E [Solirubrobacterales bacterium]